MALNKTLAHLYFMASHVFLSLLTGVEVSALSGRYNLASSCWKDSGILEKCWECLSGSAEEISSNVMNWGLWLSDRLTGRLIFATLIKKKRKEKKKGYAFVTR